MFSSVLRKFKREMVRERGEFMKKGIPQRLRSSSAIIFDMKGRGENGIQGGYCRVCK
jgi:hypothetical protein